MTPYEKLGVKWTHDDVLKNAPNVGWKEKGNVLQGIPRGDAAPLWWSNDVGDKSIIDGDPWNGVTPWFVVYEGESNQASNVRVAIHEVELWVLDSKDGSRNAATAVWEKVAAVPTPTWTGDYDLAIAVINRNTPYRDSSEGIKEFEFTPGYCLHGGTHIHRYAGDNVIASLTRVRANLVVDNPDLPSDIDRASLLMQVGGDYYPDPDKDVASGAFAPINYLPGIGGSGFRKLTANPTWHTFVSVGENGGENVEKWNPWCQAGNRNWITPEEYNVNPCPFGTYIPNLTLSPLDLLLDLINHDNKTSFTAADWLFEEIVETGITGRNTSIKGSLVNGGDLAVNEVTFRYERIDLEKLFKISELSINKAYLYPILDVEYITALLLRDYGVNIKEGFTFRHDKETDKFYLAAEPKNHAYSGETEFIVSASLVDRVPIKLLHGFNLETIYNVELASVGSNPYPASDFVIGDVSNDKTLRLVILDTNKTVLYNNETNKQIATIPIPDNTLEARVVIPHGDSEFLVFCRGYNVTYNDNSFKIYRYNKNTGYSVYMDTVANDDISYYDRTAYQTVAVERPDSSIVINMTGSLFVVDPIKKTITSLLKETCLLFKEGYVLRRLGELCKLNTDNTLTPVAATPIDIRASSFIPFGRTAEGLKVIGTRHEDPKVGSSMFVIDLDKVIIHETISNPTNNAIIDSVTSLNNHMIQVDPCDTTTPIVCTTRSSGNLYQVTVTEV